MSEAREQEPEVVLIGDTHIQRLAHTEVCLHFIFISEKLFNLTAVDEPLFWESSSCQAGF